MICDGLTLSDFTLHLYNTCASKDITKTLAQLTKRTYKYKGESSLDILPHIEIPVYPKLKRKVSLEDIEQIIQANSKKMRNEFASLSMDKPSVDQCIFTHPLSIKNCKDTNKAFMFLVENVNNLNEISLDKTSSSILSFLTEYDILETTGPIKLGKNFPIVAQLAKDSGVI